MPSRAELEELREKYLAIRALRRAREQDLVVSRAHAPPRDELRALSRRFPGALAELDRLPPEILDARIASLDRAIDRAIEIGHDEAEIAPWARGWLHVHRALRGALAVKAWLRGRRHVDDDVRRALVEALPTLPCPDDARAWIDRLDEIADPPRGRLVDVVFADAARALGVDPREVRELLMPRRIS